MLANSIKSWKDESSVEILTRLAIEAAVAANWQEAAKINKKIVTLAQNDIEALNRLARAQVCDGHIQLAQKSYKKVLVLDPYNLIAKRNLEKISKMSKNSSKNGNGEIVPAPISNFFLFEPGKTKIINLLNLAPPFVLANLNCGEILMMNLKKHGISITSNDGTYLGALPDDLAHRLLTYIAGGNKYEVFVKYATTKSLTVFIKEVERSSKFVNQPSFQIKTKDI